MLLRAFGKEYFTAALNKPVWLTAVVLQVGFALKEANWS
jgi:hypothetical protein